MHPLKNPFSLAYFLISSLILKNSNFKPTYLTFYKTFDVNFKSGIKIDLSLATQELVYVCATNPPTPILLMDLVLRLYMVCLTGHLEL